MMPMPPTSKRNSRYGRHDDREDALRLLMLREQACRNDELVVVLVAVTPGEQMVNRVGCLQRRETAIEPDFERIEFRGQLLALQSAEAGLQRQVDVRRLTADFASLELVLRKLPVAQDADDLQPEMVDFDVLADRIAVRKQVLRRVGAEDGDLRKIPVVGFVEQGRRDLPRDSIVRSTSG